MIDNGSVQIWDTHADQIVDTFHVEDAYPGAGAIFTGTPMFSADGTRLVVTTSTRGLLQFDTTTNAFQYGASISSQLQGPVAPIAGTELAVASGQLGRITQWDMSDGHVTATGRSTDPTSLNGATASSDGSLVVAPHPFTSAVALFDGRTLEPIGDPIPTGDVGEWAPLVVSPDGKRLYANGPLDSATEWNLDVDTWEAIACHAAGRNLTRDEWAEFLGDDTPYRATCAEWPPAS
jgi:hypothetical protein